MTIVSNNSGHAISQYLAVHDLPAHVSGIIVAEGEHVDRHGIP